MTDSQDYRLYLAKEFEALHKVLDEHTDKLDSLVVQTTKTNGNLTHATEEIKLSLPVIIPLLFIS